MRVVDAQYILNTLCWMDLVQASNRFKYRPRLHKDGLYHCKVDLPFIRETCNAVGKNKLDVINNVAKLSWRIIQNHYEDWEPFLLFGDMFNNPQKSDIFTKPNQFMAVEDETGEFKVVPVSQVPDAFA